MGVTTWTDAQDTQLLNGLKADRTYTQIAANLGVSKAMVSGRLYRLRQLRPDDVPQKKRQSKKLQTNAGSLTKALISQKNRHRRVDGGLNPDLRHRTNPKSILKPKLEPKPILNKTNPPERQISFGRPKNLPIEFMALEQGQCLWCVDADSVRSPANMLCCAAPVIDAAKRDGDRRSSHCAYHYELSCRVKAV